MILNLPFIRDQRKELKAGVGGFQKNLQDWGGEAKQPQALKGSRQMSTVSPALEATCSLAYDVGVGGPQKSHWVLSFVLAQCWGVSFRVGLWFHLEPIQNLIMKTKGAGALGLHQITGGGATYHPESSHPQTSWRVQPPGHFR